LLHQGKHVLPIPGTRSVEHLAQAAAAMSVTLSADMLAEIEAILPVGWAAGDRYSTAQWIGPERFC
ncbi:MAG: aldo/keto reductase, partial [Alphaproteobacteria bacterium]|nr:aldo/keto reductase [Alphaproteobacteria bacterium]